MSLSGCACLGGTMAEKSVYRLLQQHLDRQAVGFPATRSGADQLVLEQLFSTEEARLALHLSYRPSSTVEVVGQAAGQFDADQVTAMLESMFQKGAIGRKEKGGVDCWFLVPMVVGIFEFQGGSPSRKFMRAAGAYMQTWEFGKAFLSVSPSQMRTVPIHQSIPAEHHVAPYDQIRAIVECAPGPFAILKCVCRESKKSRGKECEKTHRQETCLAMNGMAAMALRRGQGREVPREEALAILGENERDGLVLQPSGAKHPDFVCSCCGCCCGMLAFQKTLSRPVDFWTSGFRAEIEAGRCTRCGMCTRRCQVGAISIPKRGTAEINAARCIGCGLCVPTCAAKALRLVERPDAAVLPEDDEALNDAIMANKKGRWGQWKMLMKMVLGIPQ